MASAADLLLEPIRTELARRLPAAMASALTITTAAIGADAAALGAARHALPSHVIVLSGADLVLPDRILSPGTLVIDGDRIADIRPGGTGPLRGHTIVPGLIDVHVHGVDGVDSLDLESASLASGDGPIRAIAASMPRYGVTAFCPTTVACAPDALSRVLGQVRRARESPAPGAARVLPAHLESNFINPEFRGAQPAACLRTPSGRARRAGRRGRAGRAGRLDGTRTIYGGRHPARNRAGGRATSAS